MAAVSFKLRLHELFQRLGIEECMNVAEAYNGLQSVADWMFNVKFNKVTVNFDKRMDIDRIFYHIGPFVQSLKLLLFHNIWYTLEELLKIQGSCTQMKSLYLMGFAQSCNGPGLFQHFYKFKVCEYRRLHIR